MVGLLECPFPAQEQFRVRNSSLETHLLTTPSTLCFSPWPVTEGNLALTPVPIEGEIHPSSSNAIAIWSIVYFSYQLLLSWIWFIISVAVSTAQSGG